MSALLLNCVNIVSDYANCIKDCDNGVIDHVNIVSDCVKGVIECITIVFRLCQHGNILCQHYV